MTNIYIYCEDCKRDVLITKLLLDKRGDSVELFPTLECGHEYLSRLRLEREL